MRFIYDSRTRLIVPRSMSKQRGFICCGVGFWYSQNGGASDPSWANRFSLLHFNGANGSTAITDQVTSNSWTAASGAKISTTQNKFGGAAAYFPTTSYIVSGRPKSDFKFLHDGTAQWTIEGWIYPSNVTQTQVLAETGGAATALAGVSVNINASSQLDVLIARVTSGTYGARAVGGVLTANQWTYIKAAFDGTNLKAFINGALVATSALVSPSSADPNNTFTFGKYTNGNTLFYNGYLDDWRITKGIADVSTTVPTAPFPDHA